MPKRLHNERPDSLIRLHVAEPAPLGLFGLAMGCLLLMCVDFGWTKGKLMMISWIFLLPALLQLIAGIFDFIRHNVFGGTAFIGYAMFWFGMSSTFYFEIDYAKNEDIEILIPSNPTRRQHYGVICIGYLIFSAVLSIISMGINRTFLAILFAIDFTFCMVILHTFVPQWFPPESVAIGLVLVFITAMYGFMAVLIMKIAGGEVLPIGRPFVNWSRYIIHDKTFIKERKGIRKRRVNTDDIAEDTDESKQVYYVEDGNGSSSLSSLDGVSRKKRIRNGKGGKYYEQIEVEAVNINITDQQNS